MAELTIESRHLNALYKLALEDLDDIIEAGWRSSSYVSCEHCHGQMYRVSMYHSGPLDVHARTIHRCPYCFNRGWYEETKRGELTAEEQIALLRYVAKLEEAVECAIDAIDYECLEDARCSLEQVYVSR